MLSLRQPLRFVRTLKDPIWSGRRLAAVPGFRLPEGAAAGTAPAAGKSSADGTPIGETWELVDRTDDNSVVAEGEFAGWTLRRLMEERCADLLGTSAATSDGRFPLLVKLLDASDRLSVQVHPDDARGAQLRASEMDAGAEAKTEAWYFLPGSEGADVLAGLREDVTLETFRARVTDADLSDLLVAHPAEPGTALLIQGGTVHAIRAGVTLLEVQQNSDTTYRVHDYGRLDASGAPRELHVEQALACADFGSPAPSLVRPEWTPLPGESNAAAAPGRAARLVSCPHFALEVLELTAPAELETDGRFRIYCAAEGTGTVEVDGAVWRLAPLDTLLLPAATPRHRVVPDPGSARGLTLVRLDAGA